MADATSLTPPLSARDHQRGPAGAPLALLHFGDYACAFCAEAHAVIEELLREAGAHVRFAYRHFPVTSPRRSRPAARAAEVAALQNAFWPMHDALSDTAGAALSEARLFDLAGGLADLDARRFRDAFHSNAGADRVQADYESAQTSGVRGAPTFFLNGRRLDALPGFSEPLAGLPEDARTATEKHLRRLATLV